MVHPLGRCVRPLLRPQITATAAMASLDARRFCKIKGSECHEKNGQRSGLPQFRSERFWLQPTSNFSWFRSPRLMGDISNPSGWNTAFLLVSHPKHPEVHTSFSFNVHHESSPKFSIVLKMKTHRTTYDELWTYLTYPPVN